MAKANYSSKDIRVLGEIEHIRLNPAMYIGHTDTPVHLVEEALDNALDEALAGYADVVAVMIDTKSGLCKILDNGRGIPIDNNTPVTISSKLFSGAKFQDKKTAYEISTGLHGVGLVAVNALSSEYRIEIYRDKKHAEYEWKNTKLKKKSIKKNGKDVPFSSKIEFIANKKVFDSIIPDIDRIRKRLIVAAAEMREEMTLVLNVDGEQQVFKMSIAEFFETYCLNQKDATIYHLVSEKKPESFNVIMAYEDAGSAAPKYMSSVNLLPVENGGTHILAFQEMLRDFFSAKAKKFGYSFRPNDCLYGLRAYLSLNLIDPNFSGQTKEKLVNKKDELIKFIKILKANLEAFATDHPERFEALLQRFQDYRRKLDSKRMVKNGTGKRVTTKFTKLKDCTSRSGSELYIVEGESAGGSIVQARSKVIHAVLPLKGKSIPNITTKKNILKNKEVGELVTAIGTGLEPHFDIGKMRYEKIICATDADHDGSHIACLVTMVIAMLMPDIIKEGYYYIAQTPLFAINEKNTFIPLWTEEALEKARQENRTISRFKGLGELSPHQLKICLLDEETRNLNQIQYSDDIESLEKLFSSAEEKRKLLEE